ncbi:MAG: sigma-70 family RNA polymerase sigma factor [Planctomycetes bacterium]|nr:sigma-70 family RNA polymerase sigma factor [Planctomycetota bacterium]
MEPPGTAFAGTDFAAFLARVEPRLMAYLWSLLGRREDAEDLFQEVGLALHREWLSVRFLDRPEGWVFRTAHNMAANFFKRKEVERRALRAAGERAPDAAGPDPSLERSEIHARVRAALAGLAEAEREAVTLKVWGGASWVEIARILDVSEDAAARLFARGLRSVAPLLRELSEDGR